MNFQGLKPIEDADFFIDLAFRRANDKSAIIRNSKIKGTRLEKSIRIEQAKLDAIKEVIYTRFMSILKAFPTIENLPEFYIEMIKCTLDFAQLKKSLGALNWAAKATVDMHKKYQLKIKKCRDLERINGYRREFYGRSSSIVKQIKAELSYLEKARRTLKGFPAIKTEPRTITIAGFPNVGKTTLLMKLTGSKADIQPYAFTTQGINVGYLKTENEKIQFLDTPGTLNRFDKMNNIEKVAFLAIKLLAEKVIYVFDLTEPYTMEEQEKLFQNLKKLNKPIFIYLSKTDIIDKENIDEFLTTHKVSSLEEIKKLI